MLKRRAYKFRLKVKPSKNEQLCRFAGCSRLIWNKALSMQKERLDQEQRRYSYEDTAAALVLWKDELPFLKEVHSQPLQQTLKDLDRALRDGLSQKKGFPRFKKKGQHDRFRFPQGIRVLDDRIYLPKLGWYGFYKSCEIEGTIKNVTVSRTAGKWYISVQVEIEGSKPVHPSTSEIGIDMGVVRFATMSDGSVLKPLNSFRKWEIKLAFAQKTLARREKFSSNWHKQKSRIQRLHTKIADVRKDFLHKASTEICNNHASIIMEDLKIRNMTKSAKGTMEHPGTNVHAKSGLNKSILDQGWYEFRRQLTYKEEWLGGEVVLINPMNTSRRCSKCGHIDSENRLKQSDFRCLQCGYIDNADVNAAKNILAAGQAVKTNQVLRQLAV